MLVSLTEVNGIITRTPRTENAASVLTPACLALRGKTLPRVIATTTEEYRR